MKRNPVSRAEIEAMIERVERETEDQERMFLLMGLEHAAGMLPSTSYSLEGWLDERKES